MGWLRIRRGWLLFKDMSLQEMAIVSASAVSKGVAGPRTKTAVDEESTKHEHQKSLARSSSILSLTLDEIQHSVCEPGKTFGSMNMDEFLTNIWTAEEANAVTTSAAVTNATTHIGNPAGVLVNGAVSTFIGNAGSSVPSLYRQGSISLPAPLCRKTVDEVWSEIHHNHNHHQYVDSGNTENAPRQPTFGEMTLEDFLVKAGVVREVGIAGYVGHCPSSSPSAHAQYAALPGGVYSMGGGMIYGEQNGGYHHQHVTYQSQPPQQVDGGSSGYNNTNNNGVKPNAGDGVAGVVYVNSNTVGGYGANGNVEDFGEVRSPVSPVSSDGFGIGKLENSRLWGVEIGGITAITSGRKRTLEGPVEKVVERRQKRMIKNRESAARSRARKQVCVLLTIISYQKSLLYSSSFLK